MQNNLKLMYNNVTLQTLAFMQVTENHYHSQQQNKLQQNFVWILLAVTQN